ncbi:MAG: transcriptional regulator [Rhizobium sp. 63-7]|nr:MAG: transcriptional regulator [Rhizobium sp. 63-7]
MAEYLSIPLAKIHVGERERPIDEDVATAIAASMAERGLINPVTLRRTPAANKGATPFTLVAGGHRYRGAQINGWEEIDAIVVEADATEAQIIELSENLYRNELTKLERPLFVLKFREIWEAQHGKIDPKGGRPKKQGNDYPVIFALGKELSKEVQRRLGFGAETYKLVTRIGQNLRPELRSLLRGTPTADDQSQLLKLAKMPVEDQLRIAAALKEGADLKQVLSWAKPAKPDVDLQESIFEKVKALLAKAEDATLLRVLHHVGDLRDFSELEDAA